ncbi:hypothetical protein FUA23_10590 [Neolewinella aurantiaca]|uniref:Uncharacterized protein n=1 Tax=Neolewinella aurantiaca TaxID=2602767 RepID=A0A5C7FT00_9BACT|nr:hypothetical protein [Neolewinella aurantiaca]TXF89405.1 hypothetical protein FUA23_10590 [Neolewinella aurantiaca]
MKSTKHTDWENRWRETLAEHQSIPTAEDWSGMKHLLETQANEPVEAIVDPNLPKLPESSTRRILKYWPHSLLFLFLLGGIGLGLRKYEVEKATNEVKGESIHFSKGADSRAENPSSNIDTTPVINNIKGPVYRFDTVYQLDAAGNLSREIYTIDTAILYPELRGDH